MTESGLNIWHVEDSASWRTAVLDTLEDAGHQVLSTASATEARGMVPDGIQGIHISILDGDLGDGKGGEIAKLIRDSKLAIGIIGLSGGSTPWADVSLDKLDFDEIALCEAVTMLSKKTTQLPVQAADKR
jgi:DNA-binding NtrC family response regulator